MPVEVPGTLLDVRELGEWQAGHAVGAVHIPMSEVPARLGEIDLDQPVHVICRSGARSARVVAWLNENGADAVNVAGGTLAWAEAGRPMEADGPGEPIVR
jgi:rhodanese-related sulfurtransferase